MKETSDQSSCWEDLVFEDRNRSYGAYAIRKAYPKNLMEASFGSILFTALILLTPLLPLFNDQVPKLAIVPEHWTHLDPVPTVIPDPNPPRPLHHEAADNSNHFQVTAQPVPEPDLSDKPTVGLPGESTGTVDPIETGLSALPAAEGIPALTEPVIFDVPEFKPEYQGGIEAMVKFLHKHFRYPNHAKSIGIEGLVFVRFIINAEGRVTSVEVIKGISEDCDREAARVISLMPDWKPGRMGPTPVSVRMVLPIKFKLEN